MKLHIYKDYKKVLCLLVLYFTLFIGFFTYNFGVQQSILYVGDVLNVILIVLLLPRIKWLFSKTEILEFMFPLFLLMIWGTLLSIVNGFSIERWIWGVRNWARLFSFFLAVVTFLDIKNCQKITNFTFKIYDVNFIIILIQFFCFRNLYTQDTFNGLFGRDTSSINITMSIILIGVSTASYLAKTVKTKRYIVSMLEILIVSIISELRVVPIIIALMVIVAVFITVRPTAKTIFKFLVVIIGGLVLFALFSYMLTAFYPDTAMSYDLKSIIKSASTKGGYGYSGKIDRLTFMSVINENVFGIRGIKFAGIGMGNAEYSVINSLCSPFYIRYGKVLGYLNFSSSYIYIETGFLGLLLYFLSFFIIFIYFAKGLKYKTYGTNRKIQYYQILGAEMALINVFYIIYNNLQRTDVSYILAFYLGIAYIGCTQRGKNV